MVVDNEVVELVTCGPHAAWLRLFASKTQEVTVVDV
jgi:hypothetical protein